MGGAGRRVWVSPTEGVGGVGAAGRSVWYPPQKCRRGGSMRCAEFGSVRDRGGGTSSPSPSAPPPVAISPRSTAWGDPGEEPDTAAHRVSPRTDPALRRGRGRSAAGAGGEGMPAEVHGYPLPQARAGRGCRRSVWLSPAGEGAGGEGRPAKLHGYPLPQARVGWRSAAGRKERRPSAAYGRI